MYNQTPAQQLAQVPKSRPEQQTKKQEMQEEVSFYSAVRRLQLNEQQVVWAELRSGDARKLYRYSPQGEVRAASVQASKTWGKGGLTRMERVGKKEEF